MSLQRLGSRVRNVRLAVALAVCGLIALGLPAIASAEPTASIAKFKALAVPIFKVGGALQFEYELEGSGYGVTPQNPKGGIPPTSQINLQLPAGVKLHPAGFGTCSEATLKGPGPSGCPASSIAGPIGYVLMEVTFGAERVPEEATLQAFFAAGGGLLFYIEGHSPVFVEIVSQGHYVKASTPYGEELITLLPPVATVPGAPLASIRTIHLELGAAFMEGAALISYLTMPTQCEAASGFPFKTEVEFGGMFGGEREFGIPAKPFTFYYKAPCPPGEESQKEREEREARERAEREANERAEREAKAKAEAEAAVKKRAEEEAAAKKHGEEEAAAKKHAEEEAAAKKHQEEAAAKNAGSPPPQPVTGAQQGVKVHKTCKKPRTKAGKKHAACKRATHNKKAKKHKHH